MQDVNTPSIKAPESVKVQVSSLAGTFASPSSPLHSSLDTAAPAQVTADLDETVKAPEQNSDLQTLMDQANIDAIGENGVPLDVHWDPSTGPAMTFAEQLAFDRHTYDTVRDNINRIMDDPVVCFDYENKRYASVKEILGTYQTDVETWGVRLLQITQGGGVLTKAEQDDYKVLLEKALFGYQVAVGLAQRRYQSYEEQKKLNAKVARKKHRR